MHGHQSLRKFKLFIQYSVYWFKNIINITFMIHISCKIWIYLRFLVKNFPKTDCQLVFCKLELEHLQVHMGIYHLEMCFCNSGLGTTINLILRSSLLELLLQLENSFCLFMCLYTSICRPLRHIGSHFDSRIPTIW